VINLLLALFLYIQCKSEFDRNCVRGLSGEGVTGSSNVTRWRLVVSKSVKRHYLIFLTYNFVFLIVGLLTFYFHPISKKMKMSSHTGWVGMELCHQGVSKIIITFC